MRGADRLATPRPQGVVGKAQPPSGGPGGGGRLRYRGMWPLYDRRLLVLGIAVVVVAGAIVYIFIGWMVGAEALDFRPAIE